MTQSATSSPHDIRIVAHTAVSCLGRGRNDHVAAMRSGRSGLAPCESWPIPFACHVGEVADLENEPFPEALAEYDNRASRIAMAALRADDFESHVERLRERLGADRVGLVVGTSTSGVEKLERAYRARSADGALPAEYSLRCHSDHHAVAAFLREHLRLEGPCYTISTACSSSAKALVDAQQLIEAGLCDAVVAGGVDSLCLTSLAGFEALQLVSRQPCRPCDADRDGLSIGEGGAFLLFERGAEQGARLSGYGESSDGYHMSTPPPDSAGAIAALRDALQRAGLSPAEIDYVNLHGTATPANDASECRAVLGVFGAETPASSLKGAIGHTLGAAGAIEAVLCLLALEEGALPPNFGLTRQDPEIACRLVASFELAPIRHVASNAFGFGGNNCALILSR